MDRTCAHCSGQLPAGCRRNRVYCSSRCTNAAAWARDSAGRAAAHRAWRDSTRVARAATRLAAKPVRHCGECGAALPIAANVRRRFCSRRCINARALRLWPERRLAANRRRRGRIRAAGSPGVTGRDWTRLIRRYCGRCAYCGTSGPMTMDHVVPIARGGRHAIGNVLPACFPCNAAKRDDFLAHWRRGIPAARLRRSLQI
jgi:5-methylcytosine-specific restriction endonuclease McrA